jgi:hypothetical protein
MNKTNKPTKNNFLYSRLYKKNNTSNNNSRFNKSNSIDEENV